MASSRSTQFSPAHPTLMKIALILFSLAGITIIIISYSHDKTATNTKTANISKSTDTSSVQTPEGTADVKRGDLNIGAMGKYLFLLSKDTGRIKSAVNIRKYFRGDFLRPAKAVLGDYGVKNLVFRDDRIYVGTVDGSLFVFRRLGE